MSKFIVYSTPTCSSCEVVKTMLFQHGKEFEVKDIESDEEALNEFIKFNARSVPQVTHKGQLIGGVKEVQEYLK